MGIASSGHLAPFRLTAYSGTEVIAGEASSPRKDKAGGSVVPRARQTCAFSTTIDDMRVISWNVNGRVGNACTAQVEAVLGREPDVVALQELTVVSYPQWCDVLLCEGFSIASSIELARLPYPLVEPPIQRRYFNAIASRSPIAALAGLSFEDPEQARVAFPEKYVAARVALDDSSLQVEIHNAHLPPGSTRGVIKPQAFSAIRRRTDDVGRALVLCGDFNTPQQEDTTCATTWAPSHPELDKAWDLAERGVLENPRLRDVYRERHRAGSPFPASHYTGKTARRYDHIYASAHLHATACIYHEAWLHERLSDHAAVEADLEAKR